MNLFEAGFVLDVEVASFALSDPPAAAAGSLLASPVISAAPAPAPLLVDCCADTCGPVAAATPPPLPFLFCLLARFLAAFASVTASNSACRFKNAACSSSLLLAQSIPRQSGQSPGSASTHLPSLRLHKPDPLRFSPPCILVHMELSRSSSRRTSGNIL